MRRRRGARAAAAPAAPDPDAPGLRARLLGFLLGAVLVCTAELAGALRPLGDALGGLRFAAVRREASQTLTVVEIDPLSLRAAGRWPWGRDRFARAIENLEAAGAEQVAFDVDFSATSAPDADRALAAAVDQRPGVVVLPSFVQKLSNTASAKMVETSPIEAFSHNALLASVNIPVDTDGRVRRYYYGFGAGDAYRQSMAALLASGPPERADDFLIDYGIRRATVSHLSFEDVYEGRFDPRLVKGRRILIGATAQELGDKFATPLKGTMPGVYVHALAYESVRAGRALTEPRPLIPLALALWCAWLLRPRAREELAKLLRRHLGVAAIAILGPVALQAVAPISVDLSMVLFAQVLCLVWAVRAELERRRRAIVREREARLLHQALHEPETELPNRRALLQEVARRLSPGGDRHLAVVAVGVDRFAALRAAIGYQRFNEVVRQVAQRASEASGEAFAAHLSTSVIGVAVAGKSRRDLEAKVARLERLDPWLSIEGLAVDAFVRTGVAYRSSASGETAEALLENASIALDRAREIERRLVVHDQESFPDPSFNIALMGDMMSALEADEFSLHYQPKIGIASGEIIGVEALVRWTHAERGFVPPDVLIATAEETGMIRGLTEWCLRRCVLDLKTLGKQGKSLTVAVNISAALLADRDFRRHLLKTVAGYEKRLCLEITESAIIRNPGEAMEAIGAYRAAGLKISIDDYGSGLSSLAYLKSIDADELKIDKSLVATVGASARDRMIVKSTVDLAHTLGMYVVAEGVENEFVLAALAGMGCDIAQGWLFAPALSMDELRAFLATHGARGADAAKDDAAAA